jgi:hypothetical protein
MRMRNIYNTIGVRKMRWSCTLAVVSTFPYPPISQRWTSDTTGSQMMQMNLFQQRKGSHGTDITLIDLDPQCANYVRVCLNWMMLKYVCWANSIEVSWGYSVVQNVPLRLLSTTRADGNWAKWIPKLTDYQCRLGIKEKFFFGGGGGGWWYNFYK